MISKEVFIKTMERLEDLNRRMNAADDVMRKLCGKIWSSLEDYKDGKYCWDETNIKPFGGQ